MRQGTMWKVVLLAAFAMAAGSVWAADTAPSSAAPASDSKAAKEKNAKGSAAAADTSKSGKVATGKGNDAKSASKEATATTAVDPGLEVPSARNRPATAATPTTGTRGFKKPPATDEKAAATGATSDATKAPASK